MPRIKKYDGTERSFYPEDLLDPELRRELNGIRWWRLVFAPFDFLVDPGIWMRDTCVVPPQEHEIDLEEGIPIGRYRVRFLHPQLYFDHGKPVAPWLVRRFRRFANRSVKPS